MIYTEEGALAVCDEDHEGLVTYIGPTWKTDDSGQFILPKRTLGWHVISWILANVGNGETGKDFGPFLLTPEQGRFILWWYAVDERGKFIYSSGFLGRLKGWGKDPVVTVIALAEALGECRFDGWADRAKTIPKVKLQPMPLVFVAAVTVEQASATLKLFRHYLTQESIKRFKIEINTEAVKVDGVIVIQVVPSNPKALEGRTPTLTLVNESHHAHSALAKEMWGVINRNAVKVAGGTSRTLQISNAFDPSMGSVAQMTREAYELDLSIKGESKILYDSVEVSPEVPVFFYEKDPHGHDILTQIDIPKTRAHIAALVELVRGDSKWSELDRIVDEFFNTMVPVADNQRFWLNALVTSENVWIDVRDFDACVTKTADADIRVKNGDTIVMFGDFSKSDDSTVLVGCRVSDGLIFKIAAWHKPGKASGPVGMKWLVPRNERDKNRYDFDDEKYVNPYRNSETVDEAVNRAFETWNVVGFFADPSHAKDEIDNKSYWTEAIERWHVQRSDSLKIWAGSKTGAKRDSITWDMIRAENMEEFAEFAERTAELIMRGELLIEREPDFRSHFTAAKKYKTRGNRESIWKGKAHSDRKIDLAVGAVGALMVRSKYLKVFGQASPTRTDFDRFMFM